MKGWSVVKLGTLLTESKVISNKPDSNKRIRVRLNMQGVEKRPDINEREGATKYYIRKAGQFIYGKQNLHKGAFGIIPEHLDGFESSSDIPAFDVDGSCYPEWILLFLRNDNFYLKLGSLAKGVGSKRIQPSQIFELDIYLPEKEEQKIIIDLVRNIDLQYKSILEEIYLQERLVKHLRSSILQDAVQGKLTKGWRMTQFNVQSASELIKLIENDKKEIAIKKEKALLTISKKEIPYEIPKDWKWVRLGSIVKDMAYGTSQKTTDDTRGIPVLRMGNISSNGELVFDNLKYISPDHSDLPRLFLEYGDLVFNRTNSFELVGKSAVFCESNFKYTLASYLIKVTPFKNHVISHYINNYIISPICRKTQIEPGIIAQTNQANFSGSKLREILFPLPPKMEQEEIVLKTNKLMQFCNVLEEEIEVIKLNVGLLLQKILNELLGVGSAIVKDDSAVINTIQNNREIKYDSNTKFMELVELLQKYGRLHAEDLWKMSKFPNDIDEFYAELKKQIEDENSIKESTEKGYLELV